MKELKRERVAIIIASNLRILRRKLNLTQEQVAELAGIDRVLYTKYETAASLMSIPKMVMVANALNVTVDDLLFGVLEEMQENS